MIRRVAWGVAVVAMAAVLPMAAQVLGYDLAGRLWQGLRLSSPLLSQVGDVLAGALGGLVVAFAETATLRIRKLRSAVLAGAAVGLAHAVYPPLTVVALPVAASLRTLPDRRRARLQGIAAAWLALALLLPFPLWAAGALVAGAAALSAYATP